MNRFLSVLLMVLLFSCNSQKQYITTNTGNTDTDVSVWLTNADQSVLFHKQDVLLKFSNSMNNYPTIKVDTSITYQIMDGFGFALTGGSAYVINKMPHSEADSLLQELFGSDNNHIGISYLRISIGASDLSTSVFTYDDPPQGQADSQLTYFSINPEENDLIPVLKKILAINPQIKILGSPWTAPIWMKNNNNSIGGSLNHLFYQSYANYFVKYIQAFKAKGIPIDAITIQNEPLNPGNNPSMLFSADEEKDFIKNYLGPVFYLNNINTKIIVYDHNCDHPEYPMTILSDSQANKYVDGSAFHLYAGDISALSKVHEAFPDKNVYFTEQWVGAPSNFSGDFNWAVKNLIVGASRNWSRVILQWNLANDLLYGPHTIGGCTSCLGAVTIGTSVQRNVAYYTIAHASKFVRPGSKRISTNIISNLQNVGFVNPEGRKVLIVLNDSNAPQTFNIEFGQKIITTNLNAGAVGTYIW